MPDKRIRRAVESDVDAMVKLVYELAEYERAPEDCHLTADQLRTTLFCESPALFAHVAELDGEVVGCALWFLNFSTWDGVDGVYLEDLYVRSRFRRLGLARGLLAALARECVDNNYTRLAWAVLNWNTDAIALYDAVGAAAQSEWTTYRLSGPELAELAGPG